MITENASPKMPKYVTNILINPLGVFLLLFNSATLINPHNVPTSKSGL